MDQYSADSVVVLHGLEGDTLPTLSFLQVYLSAHVAEIEKFWEMLWLGTLLYLFCVYIIKKLYEREKPKSSTPFS